MDKHQELMEIIRNVSTWTGTIWAVLALILLWLAWQAAKRRDIRVHKRYMIIILAVSVIAFEFWVMSFRYPQLGPLVPEGFEFWVQLPNYLKLIPLVGASLMIIARWRQSQPGEFLGYFNTHHQTLGRAFLSIWAVSYVGGLVTAMSL